MGSVAQDCPYKPPKWKSTLSTFTKLSLTFKLHQGPNRSFHSYLATRSLSLEVFHSLEPRAPDATITPELNALSLLQNYRPCTQQVGTWVGFLQGEI